MPGVASIVEGSLQTERLPNGNRKLLKSFTIDINGKRITVPAGFETDFSSIPWFGRIIVRWSKVDVAGVVHDYLYGFGDGSRSDADWAWYRIAVSGEKRANLLQAWICWFSLVLFGWMAWDKVRKTSIARKLFSRIAFGVILLSLCWFGVKLLRGVQHKHTQEQWISQFREQGANVQLLSYVRGGAIGKIPVIREFNTYHQFEVVLPTTEATVNSLRLLKTCPEVERLWIHKDNVTPEAVRKAQAACPNVDTIRYTGNL